MNDNIHEGGLMNRYDVDEEDSKSEKNYPHFIKDKIDVGGVKHEAVKCNDDIKIKFNV
jgi:hypothetical protein